MAVNYAEKYAAVIDEKFSEESRTEAAINRDYDFTGVNKVNVYSIPTVPLQDYDMAAQGNRYGTPVELGSDIQTLEMTQDKSFTFTVDRRNNTDQRRQRSGPTASGRDRAHHRQVQAGKAGRECAGNQRQRGNAVQQQCLFRFPGCLYDPVRFPRSPKGPYLFCQSRILQGYQAG